MKEERKAFSVLIYSCQDPSSCPVHVQAKHCIETIIYVTYVMQKEVGTIVIYPPEILQKLLSVGWLLHLLQSYTM